MYVGLSNKDKINICYEVAAIKKFCDRNNIDDYIIYTGCYNLDLKRIYPSIKFETLDYILYWLLQKGNTSTITTFDKNQNSNHYDKISRKFICTNRRYEGIRELVASYMLDYDTILSFNKTRLDFKIFYKNKDVTNKLYWSNIQDRLCFDYSKLPKKYKTNMYTISDSLVIDYDMEREAGDIDDQVGRFMNLEQYYKAFCAVITESRFFMPYGHFADKTLNAVKTMRPFVLFSSPHTLEYMRSLGFKTFDTFWDESYDVEEDHMLRYQKVCDVIDSINNYSIDDCKLLYSELSHIVEHNFNVLLKLQTQIGD